MSEKINERLFDLVRYMRVELHEEGLITDREYAWLASEAPPSIGLDSTYTRRLEDYDEMQAALDHTRYALRNVAEIADKGAADPETTLAQIYEAATRRPPSFGSVEWHDTLGAPVEQFNEDTERLNWLEQFLQLGGSSVSTLSAGSAQDPREDDTDATRWNHDFSIGYSAETEHRGVYTWKELSDGSRSIRKAIDGAKRASERQHLKYGIGKLADKEDHGAASFAAVEAQPKAKTWAGSIAQHYETDEDDRSFSASQQSKRSLSVNCPACRGTLEVKPYCSSCSGAGFFGAPMCSMENACGRCNGTGEPQAGEPVVWCRTCEKCGLIYPSNDQVELPPNG